MALTAAGPDNGLWGPGLAFDMHSTNGPPFNTSNHFAVTFTQVATEDTFHIVGEASAFVRGDGTATLTIGKGPITQAGAYRTGVSAGGDVWVHLHEVTPAGGDAQPPFTFGPVKWDPALVLFKLLSGTTGGGGLTAEQDQRLKDIEASVRTVYKNQP